MTAREKLIEKREAENRRRTVEVVYSDGSNGTTTVDRILAEDEQPFLSDGVSDIMVQKFAANCALSIMTKMLEVESTFGFIELDEDDLQTLNDALRMVGIEISHDDEIESVIRHGKKLIARNEIKKIAAKVSEKRYILMDTISDTTHDVLGLGFVRVGYNYVPAYQVTNVVSPINCNIKNNDVTIEIAMDPDRISDLIDTAFFEDRVCSFKQAVKNAVSIELIELQ